MQIQKIKINSVLGIENIEIFPGKINKISGKNGRGKTSFIEAIKTALGGGNDAELIHKGSDEGEVVIIFDNNMHLKRRIRGPKRGVIELHDGEGRELKAPQKELNKLYDAIAVNPVEFINVKDKERVELLLEALPVDLELNELLKHILCDIDLLGVTSDNREDLQKVYDSKYTNTLEFIDDIISQIADERRFVKRSLDEAKASIKPLKESIVELDVDADETKEEISKIDELLEKASNQYQSQVSAIESKFQEEIEQLRQKKDSKKEEIKDRFNEFKNSKTNERTSLQERLDTSAALLKTKEEIENQEKKAKKYETIWEATDTSIRSLREYKTTLLNSIPIDGLELKDGVIYRNDIPYSKLNKAQQLEIAIEVAKLRTKDIGIICVDGIEILDSESQKVLFNKFKDSDIQFFLTEVTDGEELNIATTEEK
jgi:chromosome segregation ATPase